jgi:hypothetical protein
MRVASLLSIALSVYSTAATAGANRTAVVGADVGISRLFAPESAWPAGSDASPAFTPDGRTVLFTHGNGSVLSL